MDWLTQALEMYPWGIYLCFLIGPFIQEDAAVIGAAAASSTGAGEPMLLLVSVLAGLSMSDIWKYWIGRAAITHDWAKKFAEKPGVAAARSKITDRLAMSLMIVRYVPGTRIPFYVASGFFKAPFGRFAFYIILSGATYIGLSFGLFHALGAVLGEQVKTWLPLIAVGLIVGLIATLWIRSKMRSKPA